MESMPAEYERTPSLEEDPALGLSHRAKMEVLFAVMLGLFLGALDQTIVGPALPTIVTQLHGNDVYNWVVISYLLTSTISVPFWGKLSDVYGRKPLFILGIVFFLIGSALSGLSQDMTQLILFRGIQGIGAGALFPIALAIIGDMFSPAERGKYQGLFGAVFGIAFVAGPLVGGWLTENIGWHWIFYVNVPIGIVSLFFIFRLLPTVKNPRATRNFDILGGLIFTIATSMLLIGLTYKGIHQPDHASGVRLGFAPGRRPDPGRPRRRRALHLGRVPGEGADRSAQPVPQPDVRGVDGRDVLRRLRVLRGDHLPPALVPDRPGVHAPRIPGLPLLPLIVGLIGSSIGSGLIVARTGRYKWMTVGAIVVMAVATALMSQLKADTPIPVVWIWMFIAGLGVGPTFAVFTLVVQNAVPFNMLGVATSNLTFFRQIGGTVALAIVGTVFGTAFSNQIAPSMTTAGVPQALVDGFTAGIKSAPVDTNQLTGTGDLGKTILANAGPAAAQIQPFIDKIVIGIHDAFSLAVAQTFWIGIGAAILAAVAAAAMQELALRQHTSAAAETAAKAAAERGPQTAVRAPD